MTKIADLYPKHPYRLVDLIEDIGIDVSDWKFNLKDPEKYASNPKYCYDWCFQHGDIIVFNTWYNDLYKNKDGIFQKIDFRSILDAGSPIQKRRALTFLNMAESANRAGLRVRLILQSKTEESDVFSTNAAAREIDDHLWTVHAIDVAGQTCSFKRTTTHIDSVSPGKKTFDDELGELLEGRAAIRLARHRSRERRVRDKKIRSFVSEHGRLFCEVPGCGFDFESVYGELGKNFAHVHHKIPLADAPDCGRIPKLTELAVVCPNCHAMIHRGGECREMESLIPSGPDEAPK